MRASNVAVVFVLALSMVSLSGLYSQVGAQTPPTVSIISPVQNHTVPTGSVVVQFDVQGFTIYGVGQPHLQFYIDTDPIPFEFYSAPTCDAEGTCVQYQSGHTHFVHWLTPISFEIFGLSPQQHQVRLSLANADHSELTNPEASQVVGFSVSQPSAPAFDLFTVASNLTFPVRMAATPDGRIFYNEMNTGVVRVLDSNFNLLDDPFYTFTNLQMDGQQGLAGITLDPDFTNNGFIYFYYTAANPDRNKLVRLTDSNNIGTDETVILDDLPTDGDHVSGDIHFGPDGKLYLTVGDLRQESTVQDTNSLNGKMLRYNKDGSIPDDNPFSGSPVYAYGLRNSFDFAFHGHTGDIWATENGPEGDDEVNQIIRAGNYGWPIVTGIAGDPLYIDPLVDFTPAIAPTGILDVSENSVYPAEYHSNVFFTDWLTGKIRRLVLTGPGLQELSSSTVAYDGGKGSLLDLVEGSDGFIYASSPSEIYRVVHIGDGNQVEIPIFPFGDLNCDGVINIIDVILLLQHIVGIIPTLDECSP